MRAILFLVFWVVASYSASAQSKPEFYGFYALLDGRLQKLDGKPISDLSAIPASGVIRHPPSFVFPNGKVRFVLYRRDLSVSAPDSVFVNIVAKIVREKLYGMNGQLTTDRPVSGLWNLRSRGYKFLVAPYGESREMILIRHENPDFVIPDGRYAIVYGNQYYDFLINKDSIDNEHCVEWIGQALGMGIKFPTCSVSGASVTVPPAAPHGVNDRPPPARAKNNSGTKNARQAPASEFTHETAIAFIRTLSPGCRFTESVVVHLDPEWRNPVRYGDLNARVASNFGTEELSVVGDFDAPYRKQCVILRGPYSSNKALYDKAIRGLRTLGVQVYTPESGERDITSIR